MSTNQRKQRIIDAAVTTLKQNSIEDVSMRKIAKTAGLTTGAIYHFYKSKDELLLDVMKQQLHFSTNLYDTIRDNTPDIDNQILLKRINEEVAKRIRKTDEQILHVQFFSDVIKNNCKIKKEYQETYIKMIDAVSHLFENAFLRPDMGSHKAIASILVAAMDGIALQQALGVLPEETEKIIQTYISFFNESIPLYFDSHKG